MPTAGKHQQHPNKLEYETKFVFPNYEVAHIIQWLHHICKEDKEFPHNIISSIYYDTRDWRLLREKINSDYLKSKIRVRWYQEPDDESFSETAFIEVKSKIGSPRKKFRMRAPYSARWFSEIPLDDPRLLTIPRLLTSQGVVFPQHLFPTFVIRYERYRFIEPASGTRICVDDNISTPKVNGYMLPYVNTVALHSAVLELKHGSGAIPAMFAQLSRMGGKKTAFSKYLACYQQLNRMLE